MNPLNIRPGYIKHEILQLLAKNEYVSIPGILKAFKVKLKGQTTKSVEEGHMTEMELVGHVFRRKDGTWSITVDGMALSKELDKQLEVLRAAATLPKVPGNLVSKVSGLYNGAELRRTCLRPGAYDAFDKPSLMGDKLVPRSGSYAGVVELGDVMRDLSDVE